MENKQNVISSHFLKFAKKHMKVGHGAKHVIAKGGQQYFAVKTEDTFKPKVTIFSCSVCQTTFQTKEDLKFHINSAHVQKPNCSVCELTFPNRDVLNKHIEDKHIQITNPDANKNIKTELEQPTVETEKNQCRSVETEKNQSGRSVETEKNQCRICQKTFQRAGKIQLGTYIM